MKLETLFQEKPLVRGSTDGYGSEIGKKKASVEIYRSMHIV